MALRPPQHRADALGQYIHPLDDAWDETRAFGGVFATSVDHPLRRYYAGRTRYDLNAEGVRGFLRPNASPTIFRLRRLTLAEYNQVADIQGEHARYTACARFALVDVDGEKMTVEQLYELRPSLPFEVGAAAWLYNAPPNESEGKPSGSGGGDSSPAEPGKTGGST